MKEHEIYAVVRRMNDASMIYGPMFEVRDVGIHISAETEVVCIYVLGTGEWFRASSLDKLLAKLRSIVGLEGESK